MARFCGEIGYGETVQVRPGVHEDVLTERKYYGDVLRNTLRMQDGTSVNNDLTVSNSISVLADAYASGHFFAIRYVKWAGVYWSVTSVEIQHPRPLLRLGEVYNGPKAPAAGTP